MSDIDRPSAMFDYLTGNAEGDVALLEAQLEHMGGVLETEIAENERLRGQVARVESGAISLGAFQKIWCPTCNKPTRCEVDTMEADDLNDHAGADLLCAECHMIVATLHAEPSPEVSSKE